ncbi:MAG TPA: HEAT repeat domain-containing protein, partial [Planctomycetota bacterium]|nr:HEAT repeat domain-containing protein [Planctomycetota bacterium]
KAVLRVIAMRDNLSPALREAFPGVEERLAGARDADFTDVFLAASEHADLKPADYEFLVCPALRGAPVEQLRNVLGRIMSDRFMAAVPEVARLMRHSDTSVAEYAGEVLLALDRPAAKAANLSLLADPNPNTRFSAIRRLITIGDGDVVPRLAELLNDQQPFVRQWVFVAFGKLGADSQVPRLLAALSDPIESIQAAAADALVALDPPGLAEKVRPLFRSSRESERLQCVRILAALHDEDAVPSILKQLPSTDSGMRAAVAWALADLQATHSGPALVPLLRDEVEDVRTAALWAVGVLRIKEAGADIPKLVLDPEEEARTMACWAAGRLELREAVPALLKTLAEPDPDLATAAAWPLGVLRVKEALPRLLDLSKGDGSEASVAVAAAAQLTELPSTADLMSFLETENWHFLWAFGPAVRRLRPPDLGAALIQRIQNEEGDEDQRQLAIDAVKEFRITEAVPVLLKNLGNKDVDALARGKAAEALARLGAREALPEIITLARDKECGFRTNLMAAMAEFGTREVIPEFRKFLKDPDGDIVRAAVEGLEQLDAREALDDLLPLLKGDAQVPRSTAAGWFCRAGRREGAEALLQTESKLIPINALRRPGTWKKLADLRYSQDLEGTVYELLERVAKDAGLLYQWRWTEDRSVMALLQRRTVHVERDFLTGAEVLERLFSDFDVMDVDIVLEEKLLRIVPSGAARRIFRLWLESPK